jgi:hypothetical protein
MVCGRPDTQIRLGFTSGPAFVVAYVSVCGGLEKISFELSAKFLRIFGRA